MKLMKLHFKIFLILATIVFASCQDLTELNVNPNGVDPTTVNPNLLVTTVIVSTAQGNVSYDNGPAGVMNYVQKSGWGSELNQYDWIAEKSWSFYYSNLRNIKQLYDRAGEEGMEFQQGLALVLRAHNFAGITDWWGDAPYTAAVNAPAGGQEDLFPVFDSQEIIYKGIIEDLKKANTLLSKPLDAYTGISQSNDVIYGGDPAKWRKMANSLMLRYYMRVSTKLPEYAKAGIEEIVKNPGTYPIFTSNDDDASMSFIGSSAADSWPANTTYDNSQSNFSRIQLCAGFRDVLVGTNDPRLPVWFNKVKVKITISDKYAPENDKVVDGVRYLTPSYVQSQGYVVYNRNTWQAAATEGKTIIDTMDYVGIPIAVVAYEPYNYNLNPKPTQGGYNDHVSAVADKYKAAKGEYLKARIISYSEVCFILAEAAKKGWSVGSQQTWYEKGIQASLDTWGVGGSYSTYIKNSGVAYNGTLEQIMTQKWIAAWTNANESYCDWRRTGLPALQVGPRGKRNAMPLRARYDANEKNRNGANYQAAVSKLVQTPYTAQDGNDSAWSKMWLLQ